MTLEDIDIEKERTELWTGLDEIISKSLVVMKSIKSQYDLCLDRTGPKIILSQPDIRNAYLDLANRGIKIRIITEISKENLPETKELLKIAEVRHLDGMIGNFVIADKKDYACTPQVDPETSIERLMVSNVKPFVKQQQYFFELLWQKAIPASEKIKHFEEGIPLQISEVAYGPENVITKALEILDNVTATLDLCGDSNGPAAILAAPPIHQKYKDLKSRGVHIRHIVEITPYNIDQCKKVAEFSELRHLEGLKGYSAILDSKVFASNTAADKPGAVLPHIIVSSVDALVQQQKYSFDTLWNKALPAEQRFGQLEQGIEPERTEIWDGLEYVARRSNEVLASVKIGYDHCIDEKGPSIIASNDFIKQAYLGVASRGCKIRLITSINQDNLAHCKEFMSFVEIRHMDSIKGNFGVVDRKLYGGIAETIEGQPPSRYITSNVKHFVDQQQFFFDTLWERAIPLLDRIQQLEEGVEPQTTELIIGQEAQIKKIIQCYEEEDREICSCSDASGIYFITSNPPILKVAEEFVARTGRLMRLVTEITPQNIAQCKELLKTSEIRHLEGVRNNFGVSSKHYLGFFIMHEKGIVSHVVHSTSTRVIDEQKFLFNVLWEKGVPALDRMKEIEEGIRPERTEIILGEDKIFQATLELGNQLKDSTDNCVDSNGAISFSRHLKMWQHLVSLQRRGIKIRIITEINNSNIEDCKKLAQIAEVKHLEGVQGNFGICDSKEYRASPEVISGSPPRSLICSNVGVFVKQQQYFFNTLWDKSIPAEQRFVQLEQGLEPEYTEVINGWDNVVKMLERNFSRANTIVNSIGESMLPPLLVENSLHFAGLDFLKRGGKIRLLTEVTRENLPHVKQLISTHEIRHLDGVRANFGVSDRDFCMPTAVGAPFGQPQMIITNSKEVIKNHLYLFETLWEKALPVKQRIEELEQGKEPETTQIISGWENVQSTLEKLFARTKHHVDSCSHQHDVPLLAKNDMYRPGIEFVKRGGKVRLITEITNLNVSYIKDLVPWFEIRHLTGIRANFGVSETYFSAPTSMGDNPQVVISNSEDAIKQNQYLFDTLWEKAIPASDRVKELEEGAEPEVTEVWRGVEHITTRSLEILSNIKKSYDHCFDKNVASIIVGYAPFRDAGMKMHQRGVKLRHVTEITPENISSCKELMKFVELRHLDSIQGNFGIADGIRYAAVANPKPGEPPTEQVHSTVKAFVKQQQYFFELLWNKAIPAEQRIAEIEQGVRPKVVEVIPDTHDSITRAVNLMRAAKNDYCVLFATARTFIIAAKTPGISGVYADMTKRGCRVRVLVPGPVQGDVEFDAIANDLSVQRKLMMKQAPELEIRISDASIESHISFVVADNSEVITWELKDDKINDPYEAGGIAIYSNIEALAVSYSMIFENLWNIADLTGALRASNLRLENNQKAMSEFINIAAHELRTPIQPILGLAEVLRSSVRQSEAKKNKNDALLNRRGGSLSAKVDATNNNSLGSMGPLSQEQYQMLEVIIRNAQRLGLLSEEILDVARIDAGTMKLKKEKIDLHGLVQRVVNDFMLSAATSSSSNSSIAGARPLPYVQVSCTCDNEQDGSLVVNIDPGRIAQVLSNLVSNAWKSTALTDNNNNSSHNSSNRGTKGEYGGQSMISIRIEKLSTNSKNGNIDNNDDDVQHNNNGAISVTVSDNGPGIDKDVMSRLFQKFVTKSDKGTGLGLYISKGIVEAHGGRIWAKNNAAGPGASFTFTLPMNG